MQFSKIFHLLTFCLPHQIPNQVYQNTTPKYLRNNVLQLSLCFTIQVVTYNDSIEASHIQYFCYENHCTDIVYFEATI